PIGSFFSPEMPHLAAGGGWRTSFTLVNTGPASSELFTSFYGDDGNLTNLILSSPQQPFLFNTSWMDRTLAPNQSLIFEASGSASNPFVQGLAVFTGVDPTKSGIRVSLPGFSIFHYDPSGQEAVVPLGG